MKSLNLIVQDTETADLVEFVSKLDSVKQVSEPAALEPGSALNAGIGIEDIRRMIEFVTVILSFGTAAFDFLKALRDHMKNRNAVVAVADSTSGKALGEISGATTDDELKTMLF